MARVFAGGVDDAEYNLWRETEAPYIEEQSQRLAASNGSPLVDDSEDDSFRSPRSIEEDGEWVSVHVNFGQKARPQSSADGARARRYNCESREGRLSKTVDRREVYTMPDSAKKERPIAFERVRPPAQSRKSGAGRFRAATDEGSSGNTYGESQKWADIFGRTNPGATLIAAILLQL